MSAVASGCDRRLAEGIGRANIPALLPMLVQLTGDPRWLRAPYRPRRARGVDENDSGGLPRDIQDEIRSAALAAVLAYRRGAAVALPSPSPELCVEMLACAMAEPIPANYAPLILAHLPDAAKLPDAPLALPAGFRVTIIGAGISGIGLAVHLQHAGVAFEILERGDDIGGVWRENDYPGAGVDTPNHIYGFAFAPNDWSMHYVLRDEIKTYLDGVVERYGLRASIHFGTHVEAADYDADASMWRIAAVGADGTRATLRCNVLISGVGAFSTPKRPDIPGLERFAGDCVHTAEWPRGLSTAGRRVAMIGNGASAMQVGPEIHRHVESLTIFQREPQWIAPTDQFRKPIPASLRLLMREVPYYRAWYRMRLAWTYGDRLHPTLQRDPDWAYPERALNATNDTHRAFFTNYLETELAGRPDLIEKSTPRYPPYGKRMLMDNGWYRMLRDDRVTLVTEPVAEVRADGVVTASGAEYPADMLILATGFEMRWLTSYTLVGRSGRSIREEWNDIDARAYLGTTIPDFPNFMCLYGPNLQLGHGGSWVEIVEMQINYVMDMLRLMADRSIKEFDCRREVFDAYDEEIVAAQDRMIWSHPGMSTYYRNRNGRVIVNSPLRMTDLYNRLLRVDPADYKMVHA